MHGIGFFKVHRELWDKPIWKESTPEQKVILITLIAMANFEEKSWEWKGERYVVKPGQFITSIKSIVEECGRGITTQNVRTALKRFENFGFLTTKPTNKNTLITIENWGFYQGKKEELTNELTSTSQTPNKVLTTREEGKKERIKKDMSIQQAESFDSWWNLYNRKTGKVKCEAKFKQLLKKYEYTVIEEGTKRYLHHLNDLKTNGEFVPAQKNPLTFLNGEHFNDQYEQVTTSSQTTPQAIQFTLD